VGLKQRFFWADDENLDRQQSHHCGIETSIIIVNTIWNFRSNRTIVGLKRKCQHEKPSR